MSQGDGDIEIEMLSLIPVSQCLPKHPPGCRFKLLHTFCLPAKPGCYQSFLKIQATMTMCSQITARTLRSILEPAASIRSRHPILPRNRQYATQSSLGGSPPTGGPTRKQVTVVNDDGRVRWGELSGREKAARTTQQSFNFLVVITGVVMTVGRQPQNSKSAG
jgi:hypothetical protein